MNFLIRVLASPGARWLAVLAMATAAVLSGCRAQAIEITIVNQGPALRLLEFDYPDASFGIDQLSAGSRVSHTFQIKGSGPLTLTFRDATGRTHTVTGPTVHLGQRGALLVTIGSQDSPVTWLSKLQ